MIEEKHCNYAIHGQVVISFPLSVTYRTNGNRLASILLICIQWMVPITVHPPGLESMRKIMQLICFRIRQATAEIAPPNSN